MPDPDRWFRLLLRLFPGHVRSRRGAEMRRLYRELHDERVRRLGRAGPRFWIAVTRDMVWGALLEWVALGRSSIRSEGRRGEMMKSLGNDLRFALRQLRRQPMHASLIVVLMAVGIAGNTAVFRVFNGLFLRPLPFAEANRLVDLDVTAPQWNLEYVGVSIDDFRIWERESESFEEMTAFTTGGSNLFRDGRSERVEYLAATHHIDDVLRIEPTHGRFFTESEDHPDAARVVLLAPGFWEQSFGADPGIIGTTVSMDGVAVEIIGVLPAEARFLGEVDIWMPLREDDESSFYLDAVGRLGRDVTVEQAREELTGVHLAAVDARGDDQITSPTVQGLRDRYLGDYRLGGGFLLGAVAVVLLIACGNIAGLMFARSVARRDEMVVRTALGAGRGRLVRLLLVEAAFLAVVGAMAGSALGTWGSEALVRVLSDQVPSWVTFDLDARILSFTMAATAAAALAFGLIPALGAARVDAAGLGGTRSTASHRVRRTMSGLVAAEVALAVALLVVSGLTVQDLRQLTRIDPGYRTEGVVTYRLQLPEERYREREDRLAFAEAYTDRLRTIPSVESATLASTLPLSGHSGWFFEVEGSEVPAMDDAVVLRRWVSSSYFDALDVELVRGRIFDDFDGRDEEGFVVVVNESFVRTHVPEGTDPLGQRIRTGLDNPWYTIIGVTADVKHYGLDRDMRPGTYEPVRQNPLSTVQVALATSREDPASVLAGARAATQAIDVELPLYDVRTVRERLDATLMTRRATTWLIGVFSLVALLLATAGIYGMISYSVGQRTQEISIRMAMGAATERVMRDVVRQGMLRVGIGVAVGLGLALAGARVVSGILVGVSPTAPTVYVVVSALILGVAAIANYLPARRAARLDPMSSLRGE